MIRTKKQQELFDLLLKLHDFFRDNGITYYLFGGSCIGALRHEGFIPWDDDIDIFVDRANYRKMAEAARTGLPWDDVEFVSFETDPSWYKPFAQFASLKDSCYLKSSVYNHGRSLGTRIDVMILDPVPSAMMDEYKRDMVLYQEMLCHVFTYAEDIALYKDAYNVCEEREREIGRAAVVRELQERMERYPEEQADKLAVRFYMRIFRDYDKSWIGEPVFMPFEGVSLPLPAMPEATLRYQYGYDWYIVPAEDDQEVHTFYDNFDVAACNYDRDIAPFLDMPFSERLLRDRKHINIERIPYQQQMRRTQAAVAFEKAMLPVDREQLQQAYHREDWGTCLAILAPVMRIKKQLPLLEGAQRKELEQLAAIWIPALIYSGQYYLAAKLSVSHPLLDKVLPLAAAYQDRDEAGMRKALRAFTREERRTIPDCILAAHRCGKYKDDKALALCGTYLAVVPENWDIQKLKGDLLYASGRTEEAMMIFDQVHEKTTNGLDLLDLEKRFDYSPRFA